MCPLVIVDGMCSLPCPQTQITTSSYFEQQHTHTHATFSEFTTVWLDALDKSRRIQTLQRGGTKQRSHLFNLQALNLCHQHTIQPGEHTQHFSAYQLLCANHWHGHHIHTHLASSFHFENIHLYIFTMYRF